MTTRPLPRLPRPLLSLFLLFTLIGSARAQTGSITGWVGNQATRNLLSGATVEVAALGLGVLGAIGKVVSAATRPEADIRQWGNLPQRLSFAALRLSPGNHAGRIEFLDQQGQVLTARSRPISFEVAEGGRDTVVILSELTP